ncbi:hypothetical protein Dda_5797 [Drechslerella dactyloides]|uniref:Uncharacterized protein n=1 Tax=Drechslerella dactyloides TaxID=74499 RepID=A0AAD6IV37_DREDA|nr:hypothetical protein Dda_5797 [Drechslerella dactyloides]
MLGKGLRAASPAAPTSKTRLRADHHLSPHHHSTETTVLPPRITKSPSQEQQPASHPAEASPIIKYSEPTSISIAAGIVRHRNDKPRCYSSPQVRCGGAGRRRLASYSVAQGISMFTSSEIRQTLSSLPIFNYLPKSPSSTYSHGHSRFSSDLESSASSSSSSPASPSSPLLRETLADEKPARPRVRRQQSSPFKIHRVKTLFLRVLAGCVVVTVVTMAFALSGMRKHTTKALEKHLDTDAIWKSFPQMQSYYNGLYEIIPKSENVPENTGPLNIPKEPTLSKRLFRRSKSPSPLKPASKPESKPAEQQKPKPRPIPETVAYNPYPDYQSKSYKQLWQGSHVDCVPILSNITSTSTEMRAYKGVPRGLPDPYYSSYEVLGLDNDICFDRRTRLGMYGLKDRDEIPKNAKEEGILYDLEWKDVDWKSIQKKCVQLNQDRFAPLPATENESETEVETETEIELEGEKETRSMPDSSTKQFRARTAVILRVWDTYRWTRLDYANLRSLITELNLKSGGEYDVHILMQVKDDKIPIMVDEDAYARVVEESIAAEFRGLVTLWNENMMETWYASLGVKWGGLSIHGAYRSMWFAIQYFAHKHPEYDYFWNLEADIRSTGHWYHLLEKVANFSKAQPRRGLWERNSRFYIPSVHGSWADFSAMVAKQADASESVWGPVEVPGVQTTYRTPKPPVERPEQDTESSWGVGEEADLISLTPLFDPKNTSWILRDDFTGYGQERPANNHRNPYWAGPPRRASIVAVYRLSRRLLEVMHEENTFHGHTMCTEQWPPSAALHHGLKAVYAPHPVYMDRRWPGKYLATVLNNGKNGSSGGAPKSIFGYREHHFAGSGFYFGSYWPRRLYRRWVGRWDSEWQEKWEEEHGRMCLPPMLLHPVKAL